MELEDWLKIGSVVTSRTEGNMSALMILTLNVWTLHVECHRALYWGQHCLFCMLIICVMSQNLDILHMWFQVNKLSLNVAKTNFMIFGNKRYEENDMVSINGMNINRVYVTKFLGVHTDSKLNWNEHIRVIKTKVAKNVSIMNRVKHCLISSALYSLYCTLILPYLSYCCEIWGNTYKSRIYPLYIMQKRAIRICGNSDYRAHTRPIFYQFKTLCLPDLVNFNSMVFSSA